MIRLFAIGIQICVLLMSFILPLPAPAQDKFTNLADAVYKTLEHNPGVLIKKETVAEAEGIHQTSTGEFDWNFFTTMTAKQTTLPVSMADQASQTSAIKTQNDQITFLNSFPGASFDLVDSYVADEFEEDTVVISTGMNKQFETGITFTPSISITDYESDTSPEPAVRSNVNLKIVIPMMKGLGRQIAGADQMAAESNLRAVELSSYHKISEDVYLTIINFWNCLAAKQSFDLVQESFSRSDVLFSNVNHMVTAGLLEPAFLNQAKAKLYTTKVNVRDGEISYYETRQALALAMGSSSDELFHPPFPQGSFPLVMASGTVTVLLPKKYIETARANRLDYHAALTEIETKKISLKKARNNKKPKLDLSFQVGYSGISEQTNHVRYLDSIGSRGTGVNGYIGLNLVLPIVNNAARGQILTQNASVNIARLTAEASFNKITSEVLMAIENIKGLVAQYGLAFESAERYKDAVAFEKKKYDAGESTLNALIDIEDRYIDARLSVIEIVRKYAVAITNLKFVTGSLLERKKDELQINPRSQMSELK